MTATIWSIIHFCFLYFQCSSRRTSTKASLCLSSPSRRSWVRQRTAPSQSGLPAACRSLRSPVTSPRSLDTPRPSLTHPPKTTAAPKARGAMKTSRCCQSWRTLTEWRQRNSSAVCATSPTPRTLDCSSTNSCTATPKRGNPSVVNTARRSTSALELSKCTSGLTRCLAFAKYAGKLSPDRGCSKDTSGRIPVSESGLLCCQCQIQAATVFICCPAYDSFVEKPINKTFNSCYSSLDIYSENENIDFIDRSC